MSKIHYSIDCNIDKSMFPEFALPYLAREMITRFDGISKIINSEFFPEEKRELEAVLPVWLTKCIKAPKINVNGLLAEQRASDCPVWTITNPKHENSYHNGSVHGPRLLARNKSQKHVVGPDGVIVTVGEACDGFDDSYGGLSWKLPSLNFPKISTNYKKLENCNFLGKLSVIAVIYQPLYWQLHSLGCITKYSKPIQPDDSWMIVGLKTDCKNEIDNEWILLESNNCEDTINEYCEQSSCLSSP